MYKIAFIPGSFVGAINRVTRYSNNTGILGSEPQEHSHHGPGLYHKEGHPALPDLGQIQGNWNDQGIEDL